MSNGKIAIHCEEEKVNLCVSNIKTSDIESFIDIFFIKPIRIMGEEEADRLMDTQPSFSELLQLFSLVLHLRFSDLCQLLLISLQAVREHGLTWSYSKLQSIIRDTIVIPPLLWL